MVYDVSNERSYNHLESWYQNFSDSAHVDGLPFVILGNKCDMGPRVNQNKVKADWIECDRV